MITQGEWKVSVSAFEKVSSYRGKTTAFRRFVVDENQEQIAEVQAYTVEEVDANTYLIAAAPDMYDVLRRGRRVIATLGIMAGVTESQSREFAELIKSFDETLAKAEGK